MNHRNIEKKMLNNYFVAIGVTVLFVLSCGTNKTDTSSLFTMVKYEFMIKDQSNSVSRAVLEYPFYKGGSQTKTVLDQINYHIGPEGVLRKKPN